MSARGREQNRDENDETHEETLHLVLREVMLLTSRREPKTPTGLRQELFTSAASPAGTRCDRTRDKSADRRTSFRNAARWRSCGV